MGKYAFIGPPASGKTYTAQQHYSRHLLVEEGDLLKPIRRYTTEDVLNAKDVVFCCWTLCSFLRYFGKAPEELGFKVKLFPNHALRKLQRDADRKRRASSGTGGSR